MFLDFLFKKKKTTTPVVQKNVQQKTTNNKKAERKGALGEYKIDIQLSQLPKGFLFLNDVMIENPASSTGYSQIDHIVISPHALFVIETKNYQGTIYGGKKRKNWLINGKFPFMSPLAQNYGHIQAIKRCAKDLIDTSSVVSLISFTKRCTFKVDEELRKVTSNELVIYDIELTEFIQRKSANIRLQKPAPIYSESDRKRLFELLSQANITDDSLRKQHVEHIKQTSSEKKSENAVCHECQSAVSEKVRSYCLSQSKFQGEIYCYTHQKTFTNQKR
ncbi:nuclease-related domain-containing protein [Bacillus xiamenensis]|uniref:nuclease-related domain-containing protein n=1 Tax=Bacillus xiamenensis TaxID=1178537 RepID=UPI002221B311|nr:nuclease-related domain-containing protein [Bacillus xiamenensis]MCW1837929.1 NERD domain-containing protein [Bacillus xiamenensis]